jgi:hypothetical protein
MASTPYELNFMKERKSEKTCEKLLTDEDMIKFRRVSLQGFVIAAGGPLCAANLMSFQGAVCLLQQWCA